MALKISCDACGHEALWTQRYMERKLARWKGATLIRVAYKLRCAGCRSEYIRIWRHGWEVKPTAEPPNGRPQKKVAGPS